MIDFSSSLYLGFNHPFHQIKKWDKISLGKPAILKEVPVSKVLANQIADLQGLKNGVFGPSTFHLFWDFFNGLSPEKHIIYFDEGIYPIAKWGIQHARCRGVKIKKFKHFDHVQLSALLSKDEPLKKKPVIVSDSWCLSCSAPFPLEVYSFLAKKHGGILVIDDSQTFGLFGNRPTKRMPFGKGGGGILKWLNLTGNHLITINSLAKAFGVPIACISGSTELIKVYKGKSQIRVYNSPPSIPVVYAVQNALWINQQSGDFLRNKLLGNVLYFKKELQYLGIEVLGGFFPFQKIKTEKSQHKNHPYQLLKKSGVLTVPVATDGNPQIGFLMRADIPNSFLIEGIKKTKKIIQEISYPYAKFKYFSSR